MSPLSLIAAVLLLALHSSPVASIRPGGDVFFSTNSTSAAASSRIPTASAAAVAAVRGTLRFTSVTSEAPWSARAIGAVELFTRPLTFTPTSGTRSVTYPANSFVLHGGSGGGNDVWVSSDHGKNWQLAAGVTIDDEPAGGTAAETSFTNHLAPAVLIDYNSNIFRLGGRERINGQDEYYPDVWTTTNGVKWTDLAETSTRLFDSERFYAGAIATSKNELILQGGTINNFAEYRNDVWSSTNGGRTWNLQTDATEFGTRGIGVLLQSQHNDRLAGKDILYLLGGQNEKDNNNEVWTSSDSGKSWQPLNSKSPWPQRDAFNGEITKDGVIVISSGLGDTDLGLALEAPLNDVWVSLNGGYTWGQCAEDAEFDDRYLQFTMLDEAGYLYVVAGRATGGAQFNDVWRSSVSFHDIDAVSKACNVPIPSCGVGLRCYPNSGTVVAADGSYVSCDACPQGAAATATSGVSAVVIALAVFVVLFVLTAGALIYVIRRGAAAASAAGGAASWWQKSSATDSNSSLIGGTDTFGHSGANYAQA